MRSGMQGTVFGLAAAIVLLAACDDGKGDTEGDASLRAAREAAEASLRSTAGAGATLRGVHTYKQARDSAAAICGQINLQDGGAGNAFTLFVAVVTPRNGRLEVEQHVATSGSTASRVFVETVLRCYDDGGPPPGQRIGAPPPMPVVPDRLPTDIRETAPVPPQRMAGAQQPPAMAKFQVTLRQNGNLRMHPNGGGTVLRIVSAGTNLIVFEEAPGGWLRVGDTEPWGWMHTSLMR